MLARQGIALAALVIISTAPAEGKAHGGTHHEKNRLRLHALTTKVDFGPLTSGAGVGLDWERLVRPRFGIRFGASAADLDEWFYEDGTQLTFLSGAALLHLRPGRVADFYLGPGLAWAEDSGQGPGLDLNDSLHPMFQLGFDALPTGARFGVNLDIKYVHGIPGHYDDPWIWDWDNHHPEDGVDHEDGFSLSFAAGLVVRF